MGDLSIGQEDNSWARLSGGRVLDPVLVVLLASLILLVPVRVTDLPTPAFLSTPPPTGTVSLCVRDGP